MQIYWWKITDYILSLQDDLEIHYSFESKATGARFIVDHILMTPSLFDLFYFDFMQTYDVRHDGDNLSDHSVIYTVLNLDMKNSTCTGDTGVTAQINPSDWTIPGYSLDYTLGIIWELPDYTPGYTLGALILASQNGHMM